MEVFWAVKRARQLCSSVRGIYVKRFSLYVRRYKLQQYYMDDLKEGTMC